MSLPKKICLNCCCRPDHIVGDHVLNRLILSYWKILPKIKFPEGSFIESADFANKRNYYNVGIGLIDSILSKAVTDNKHLIWTLDKKLLNNLDDKLLYKSH